MHVCDCGTHTVHRGWSLRACVGQEGVGTRPRGAPSLCTPLGPLQSQPCAHTPAIVSVSQQQTRGRRRFQAARAAGRPGGCPRGLHESWGRPHGTCSAGSFLRLRCQPQLSLTAQAGNRDAQHLTARGDPRGLPGNLATGTTRGIGEKVRTGPTRGVVLLLGARYPGRRVSRALAGEPGCPAELTARWLRLTSPRSLEDRRCPPSPPLPTGVPLASCDTWLLWAGLAGGTAAFGGHRDA